MGTCSAAFAQEVPHMTMEPSGKRPFLFVHSNGPTHVHRDDKSVETQIRRHIMVDIGRARRKPPRNPQIDTILHLPTNTEEERVGPHGNVSDQSSQNYLTPASVDDWAVASLAPPFWDQHPLAVLEKQYGMDMFSAYGITLMMAEGKNPAGTSHSADTFWFPFAFRESAFLRQFQQIFTDPDLLTAMYLESPAKLKYLALNRSLGTIACIESRLASPDSSTATSNSVISGVLALICYNFVNFDFDQALIHLSGLGLLIAARGGICRLQGGNELRLMVFWVDITASLLYNMKPRFPLPSDLVPIVQPAECSETLLMPLCSIMKAEPTKDEHFMYIVSCMTDLDAVASLIEFEYAAKCNGLWKDEEYMGLRINPIAHRLLDRPAQVASMGVGELISEALRLGAILWIIWIKRRYRSYPGTSTAYVSKLLSLLSMQHGWKDTSSASDLLSIRLWLLVLCGISSCGTTRERTTSIDMIAHEIRQLKGNAWAEVMVRVRQMPWVSVFEAPCTELERLVKETG